MHNDGSASLRQGPLNEVPPDFDFYWFQEILGRNVRPTERRKQHNQQFFHIGKSIRIPNHEGSQVPKNHGPGHRQGRIKSRHPIGRPFPFICRPIRGLRCNVTNIETID